MKHFLLLFGLLMSFSTYSQSYDIGIIEVMGGRMKIEGDVKFIDGVVYIHQITKDAEEELNFDIMNERNGVIYVSDGTETFEIRIIESPGKKKGFNYSHIMTFYQPSRIAYMYYLNQTDS